MATETPTTQPEETNGNARSEVPETTFPLDSFKAAAVHLRRPFTAEAVKFKVQATWPKVNPTGGLIVAYIDARLAVERLNLIVPHLWYDAYEPLGQKHLICKLTVDGITRQDIGEGAGKGLYSDALKRAAVKFGVGVSLYAIPSMTLRAGNHLVKKQTRDGESLALTPVGEGHVRTIYASWLQAHGIEAFGEPLNHGDVLGAAGDAEVEAAEAAVPEAATPPPPPAPPTPELSPALVDNLRAAFKDTGMPHDWLRMQLVAAGAADVPEGTVTVATIKQLAREQAEEVIAVCDRMVAERAEVKS